MNKNTRAFTLIELIVYMGILTVVLLSVVNFSWEVVYGDAKARAAREVQQGSRLAMEKISEAILGASGITSPITGASSTSLSLAMQNPDLNPTMIQLADGRLTIAQGGEGPYELTNNRISVTDFQVANVSYPDTPGTVKIQMTVGYLNPSNIDYLDAFLDSETSVSLRK